MKIKTIVIILYVCFAIYPCSAFCNGSAWSYGVFGGTPGPVRQNDLFIEKEYVVIHSPKVTADFWIKNPTNKTITIPMGFPFVYLSPHKDKDNKNKEQIIEQNRTIFDVRVNDKLVEYKINIFDDDEYPIVINWKMEFPPNAITKFTVTYPFLTHGGEGTDPLRGGSVINWKFQYITHTGSYWAKPIKNAIFEYYGEGVNFLSIKPSGNLFICADVGYDIEKKILMKVSPLPYVVDNMKNCIRWERKDWTPIKGKDDISIFYSKSFTDLRSWGGSCEDIFNTWCGLNKKPPENHFADRLNLDSQLLTTLEIDKLAIDAYVYVSGTTEKCNGPCDNFYKLPDYLSTKYKLMLLKYLRNYIISKTGHEFKDQELANCFSNIGNPSLELSAYEIENIKFIRKMEKKLNKQLEVAIKKQCNGTIYTTGIIDGPANIRNKPQGTIIAVFRDRKKVIILQSKGDWVLIIEDIDYIIGWTYKDNIKKE